MNVAITFRDDLALHQLVHGNGIAQNAKFLYDLLELIDCQPFFLCFGKNPSHNFEFSDKQYNFMLFEQLVESKKEVPVVLEVAVTLNPNHRKELRKVNKSKIVSVRYGNSLVLDVEETFLYDKTQGSIHVPEPDMVWTSPHYLRNKSYLETIYRSRVETCAYIWEPDFISSDLQSQVGYGKPDIFVMEPNIGVMKNALIPLCVISRLYEERPDYFGKATILNSFDFKDKKYFLNNIVRNLPGLSSQTDKVYFSGRATFDDVFKRDDILLGHHWENGLNYLYLEAVYKGVRLVHNSEYMIDIGFYYPNCDVNEGVEACKQAASYSSADFAKENEKNKKSLSVFSIQNKAVQRQYKHLLNSVLSS